MEREEHRGKTVSISESPSISVLASEKFGAGPRSPIYFKVPTLESTVAFCFNTERLPEREAHVRGHTH